MSNDRFPRSTFPDNFSLLDNENEEEIPSSALRDLINIGKHHMEIALELTKLIATKNPELKSEKDILATFKNVTHVVSENFLLSQLQERKENHDLNVLLS